MMRAERVDLYRDSAGKWRWRYRAANGKVLADSGQGYRRREDAVRGLEMVTATEFHEESYCGPELRAHRRLHHPLIEVRVLDDKAGA